MHASRRMKAVALFSMFVLGAGGCSWFSSPPPPPPPPYSTANPGPWADVKVSVLPEPGKVTIKVENYKPQPGDYVQRFEMVDGEGKIVGQRVFEVGTEPQETFLLGPETKTVTVTITSTGRGRWRTEPRAIPAQPPPTPKLQ